MNATTNDGRATAPESPATTPPPAGAGLAATATGATPPADTGKAVSRAVKALLTGPRAVKAGISPDGKVQRAYKLEPRTKPLPKRVEKLLIRSLKLRARAGEMFGESSELLLRALAETRGSSRVKIIEPGQVYAFSQQVNIGGKPKSTVQIQDNFTAPEVTKVCRVERWAVKTWKGDGPAAERSERMAVQANSNAEDVLP